MPPAGVRAAAAAAAPPHSLELLPLFLSLFALQLIPSASCCPPTAVQPPPGRAAPRTCPPSGAGTRRCTLAAFMSAAEACERVWREIREARTFRSRRARPSRDARCLMCACNTPPLVHARVLAMSLLALGGRESLRGRGELCTWGIWEEYRCRHADPIPKPDPVLAAKTNSGGARREARCHGSGGHEGRGHAWRLRRARPKLVRATGYSQRRQAGSCHGRKGRRTAGGAARCGSRTACAASSTCCSPVVAQCWHTRPCRGWHCHRPVSSASQCEPQRSCASVSRRRRFGTAARYAAEVSAAARRRCTPLTQCATLVPVVASSAAGRRG